MQRGVGDFELSCGRFARAKPVLQLVTGLGDTGAALCRAGIDKLAFTGSAATGRKVMVACAEDLVPVLMECGGKDALLVDADGKVEFGAAGPRGTNDLLQRLGLANNGFRFGRGSNGGRGN